MDSKNGITDEMEMIFKNGLEFSHFSEMSVETQECLDQTCQYTYPDSKQDFQA